MIKSFQCRDTEKTWHHELVRRWDVDTRKTALRKLTWLDAAKDMRDLRIPPGSRLEKLKGDRAGQYSIRVNDQWRICFDWSDGHAWNVEIVDYH
ncbi:MAG: type II toxin-antitoxin system RelE/ParE family toxin [bacterium]